MSQHDFNIANQSFPATRTDLNNALVALASNSSGDTEPGTTYANQWWYETDTNILKLRNEANNGWVDVITLDASMTATASELNQLDDITRGSILYGNASGATARLAKGSAGTVLTSDGTDISWAAASGGGATEFISSLDASSSATLTFTGFDDSKYDNYLFTFANMRPDSNNRSLRLLTSTDGGSNYDVSYHSNYGGPNNSVFVGGGDLSEGAITVTSSQGTDTGEDNGASGHLFIYGPHLAQFTRVTGQSSFVRANAELYTIIFGGATKSAADVDAVKFQYNVGNILAGTITMCGIKNS
jgi:hypothetical protein